jgi:transposase
MEVLYRRCCGLDVHKETVVACLRIVSGGEIVREVRTFETTTASLIALSEWLAEIGCTHVAMEATGVYWKPVWHILADGEFQLILANASHVKNVPGRKTDVKDATWLADLLAHGLIRASFVPDAQTQELRNLLRTRKQLVREKARHILRVQKTLEDANIKLDSVITEVMGMSGRAMIEALIAGESDPAKLASLANYRLKTSQEKLREALRGRPSTTASCCAFISIRLMLSTQPSPRSTGKWRQASRRFGSQSNKCRQSPALGTSARRLSSLRSAPT